MFATTLITSKMSGHQMSKQHCFVYRIIFRIVSHGVVNKIQVNIRGTSIQSTYYLFICVCYLTKKYHIQFVQQYGFVDSLE